jgi:hypothetical protein
LRTMSARQLQRLETKVDERHGWALARSHEEVLALEDKLEDEQYDHLLVKQALVLRAKEQKKKDKESLTGVEVKHDRLNVLLTAAVQESKLLERQMRVTNVQGEKAEERIEALEVAMERLTVALETKGRELDSADANLKEANEELRRMCMHGAQRDVCGKGLAERQGEICAGVGKEVATEKQAETGCSKARTG